MFDLNCHGEASLRFVLSLFGLVFMKFRNLSTEKTISKTPLSLFRQATS